MRQPGTRLSLVLRLNLLCAQTSQWSQLWPGPQVAPRTGGASLHSCLRPSEPTQLSGSIKDKRKTGGIISRLIVSWGRKEEKNKTTFSQKIRFSGGPSLCFPEKGTFFFFFISSHLFWTKLKPWRQVLQSHPQPPSPAACCLAADLLLR